MEDAIAGVTCLPVGHDATVLSMQDRVDQVLDFMEDCCLVCDGPMDTVKGEAQTASKS